MNSTKGQTQQVFVYILTIVIVAMIFIFGYRAVNYFLDQGEQVSYVKFITDIKDTVRIMGPKYNSVDNKEFLLGGDFTEVCFVDGPLVGPANHPIMGNIITSGTTDNMFLFTSTESPQQENIGKIQVGPGDYFCPKVIQGRLRLQFKGLGNRTLISEWPYS